MDALRMVSRMHEPANCAMAPVGVRMSKILIVDDDKVSCTLLARLLSSEGYDVDWVTSGAEAFAYGEPKFPKLLISDWLLKDGLGGLEVARTLIGRWPQLRVLFITGMPVAQLHSETQGLPVIGILEKPLNFDELLDKVGKFFGSGNVQAEGPK